jgi:mannose-6-phosphate isomerase-like protein (cupin superfamily)
MLSKAKQAAIVDAGEGRKLNVLGHTVNVLLGSAKTQGDSFVFEAISPAGLVVPPHLHENEDEYGYIVEGSYEIYLGEHTYEAGAGAVLYFPRHISHGFRNIGSTTGKMIWVSTPGAAVERFFDELGALPANVPPDMQKLVDIFARYDMQVFPPPAM